MKKIAFLLCVVLSMQVTNLFAQATGNFNYQAVVRNSNGELIANQTIEVKLSIIETAIDDAPVYTESHSVTTTNLGIINLQVGDGETSLGDFSQINWAITPKFIQIEVNAGTGLINLGTFQLFSVPYALIANAAENASSAGYADIADYADSSRVAGTAYTANKADLLGSDGVYSTNTDTLFVVKDHGGNVVFAVFPDGAEVIVNETAKGKVGGFAVSGRSPSKATDVNILKITQDSTRIYVNDTVNAKGKVGGFAVSGRSPSKSTSTDILYVTADSTRIFVNDNPAAKSKVGGFAVSGRSPSKSVTNSFLQVTPDSTRIFVKDSVAGFGVANIEGGNAENFLNLNKQNYFIGHQTGAGITSGVYNIMLGYESGLSNETGSYNTFLGFQSGYLNNSNYNSFIGYLSGRFNTLGEYNTFIGYESGKNNVDGDYNVFLGHQTGYENTSGHENVFIGYRSGFTNTGGYDNIFIGNLAGENASANTHSTFIGNEAGRNVIGDDNISIGDRSGTNQYLTSYETFGMTILGIDAGRNISGSYNTILGYGAGSSWGGAATGSNNVFIGASAGGGGYTTKLGSNNVCIGYQAGNGASGDDQLFIANNSSSTLIYGDFSASEVYIGGDLYATLAGPSDIDLKQNLIKIKSGLSLISSLTAYYFNWNDAAKKEFNYSDSQQVGLIAQDVEKVLPQLVITNSKGYKAVDYTKLSPVIIEAIQEQQTQIEDLKKENEALKQKLGEIIKLLEGK